MKTIPYRQYTITPQVDPDTGRHYASIADAIRPITETIRCDNRRGAVIAAQSYIDSLLDSPRTNPTNTELTAAGLRAIVNRQAKTILEKDARIAELEAALENALREWLYAKDPKETNWEARLNRHDMPPYEAIKRVLEGGE